MLITRVVFLSFALVGCSQSQPPKDVELIDVYINNKPIFNSFLQFCRDNSSVSVVDFNKERISYNSFVEDKPQPSDIKKVYESLRKIKAIHLMCLNDWRNESSPFFGVQVGFYKTGLAVSGSSKGIVFYSRKNQFIKNSLKTGDLKPLVKGSEGWYIFSNS